MNNNWEYFRSVSLWDRDAETLHELSESIICQVIRNYTKHEIKAKSPSLIIFWSFFKVAFFKITIMLFLEREKKNRHYVGYSFCRMVVVH